MVWPFTGLFSRFRAAPSPAKKAVAVRKAPVSPATEARLIDAWEERTVGELRDTLEEVGWDVESLERLLQRVGAPEEPTGGMGPARRVLASADKPKKRPRTPLLPDSDDEEEDEDEEFDLSPRAARAKQSRGAAGRLRPPHGETTPPPGAKSPLRQGGKTPTAVSPPRPDNMSPTRPNCVLMTVGVEAMSAEQLKSEFERIFGFRPKSGNMAWLRRKLDALKKGTDLNVGSGNRGRPPTHTLAASP